MQTNLVILVDMDGVMCDFAGGWVKAWNKKYPDRIIDEPCSSFYLEEAYGKYGSSEEICEIFATPGFYLDLEPLPGAINGVKQMAACGINVFFCTAPSEPCSWTEKVEWINHYLGKEWTRRMVITKDKTVVHGDYLIDDKPLIEGVYSDPSWEHILYDQEYNQHVDEYGKEKRFRITWSTWPSLLIYDANKGRV